MPIAGDEAKTEEKGRLKGGNIVQRFTLPITRLPITPLSLHALLNPLLCLEASLFLLLPFVRYILPPVAFALLLFNLGLTHNGMHRGSLSEDKG
jgi:hypothetical protein